MALPSVVAGQISRPGDFHSTRIGPSLGCNATVSHSLGWTGSARTEKIRGPNALLLAGGEADANATSPEAPQHTMHSRANLVASPMQPITLTTHRTSLWLHVTT